MPLIEHFSAVPPHPYNKSFINLSRSLTEECISHLLKPTAFHPAPRTTLISESPEEKKKTHSYLSAAMGSEGPVSTLLGEGSTAAC